MSDGVTLTKGEGRRRQTLPTLSFSLGHGATARQPGQSHFLLTPGQGLQKPQDIYEPLRAITIKGKKGQSQCPGGPGASSTWRLPLRGTALSPGELPALWHHHLLVQSQDRGRAGAVRTIKSESPPAPPATSGPVAGDKKPPHGAEILRRASGLQATRWREEVKPHLPTRAMLPGNHRMDREFPRARKRFPHRNTELM